jgi:tryptophanase
MLPHIPQSQFPAQALALAAYRMGGIRSSEIGSVTFGRKDKKTGQMIPAPLELTRLAVPRRVYTNSHLHYVAEVLGKILARPDQARGLRMTYEPERLRHFTARYEEI